MKPLKPRHQERRAQILEEAMAMLGDHGFNGLTVQALAQRCGMSNAGLLYYFGSKEDTLLAVLDEFERGEREIMAPLVQTIEQNRGNPEGVRPAIFELLRQMVLRFAMRPELARFLYMLQAEALDRTHVAHAWFQERDRLTLELYASMFEGLVPEPVSTARHVIAAMHGLAQQWLMRDMTFDLPAEWTKLAALVVPLDEGKVA